DRVHVFEAMKIRILNGGHQVIAPAGDLLGHATIAEAMADPMIRALLRKVVGEEIAPHVAPTPERTAHDYLDLVEARFANPRIADTTRRVAFDGSSRQPGFIVPSVIDGLDTGTSVRGLALVSAIWSRYCEGVREDRSLIEPNDPHWSALGVAARAARDDPAAWLAMRQYYGDLGQAPVFAQCFAQWRRFIDFHGVAAAIRAYVGS
ncbi:MAG: mannitol dehydrogenase family protein, partial [Pseudomonadota bacterium]